MKGDHSVVSDDNIIEKEKYQMWYLNGLNAL